MATFPQPPNEKNMKNNYNYKGDGRYNPSTRIPYNIDTTPWIKDRDRPYFINQGTGQYAKTTRETNEIWKKNGCDRYRRTPYHRRPAKCKWKYFRSWGRDAREKKAKSYRDEARYKEKISRRNRDHLKKQYDKLADNENRVKRDIGNYNAEIGRINNYYYPEHKKIEKKTEQNKTKAIKERNSAENTRDITYRILLGKRETRENKTNEYGDKSNSVNNQIIDRDNLKTEIQNTIEDIDVTQANLLTEDQTLKDNWLLNYYYALGNKRKQLTFGEFQKQNESLEKKTNKILKTNLLYDRENMYLQEQNVYLLLFNRNGLILYYLMFFYFAYTFLRYRQDASFNTKLLYLVPLSVFPFFIAIFLYVLHYVTLMLK
jgi:hypothetical protein